MASNEMLSVTPSATKLKSTKGIDPTSLPRSSPGPLKKRASGFDGACVIHFERCLLPNVIANTIYRERDRVASDRVGVQTCDANGASRVVGEAFGDRIQVVVGVRPRAETDSAVCFAWSEGVLHAVTTTDVETAGDREELNRHEVSTGVR